MPVYEFVCENCNQDITVEKPISEPHPELCECGGELRRVFSPLGISFKGTGFYRTDNRSK